MSGDVQDWGAVEERVARLEAQNAAQAQLIESQRRALESLMTERSAARDVDDPAPAAVPESARPDRRSMLRHAGALVAGTVAGATAAAVATAAPAAAASGSFDGNPAVTATGTGFDSTAILAQGSSPAGLALDVDGTARFGSATGIAQAFGVTVQNTVGNGLSASGGNFGILGSSGADSGVGIRGFATGQNAVGVVGDGPTGGRFIGTTRALDVNGPARFDRSGGIPQEFAVTVNSAVGNGLTAAGGNFGLLGSSGADHGVGVRGFGTGTGAVGVMGDAAIGGRFAGTTANLLLAPGTSPTGPPGGAHALGELYCDAAGAVFLCVGAGTPGTWLEVSGPKSAGAFHVLPATQRIYDSRPGTQPPASGSLIKGKFGHTTERAIACNLEQQSAGVPSNATAVLVNLTATDTSAGGFFAAYKNGIPYPGNSSVNWGAPGMTIANSAVVAIDTAARFKVRCEGPASGSVPAGAHLIVDLVGYYR